MKRNKSSVLGPVKSITYGVLFAIAIILLGIILLHYFDRHRAHDDKIIVNVFGKQRTYSQLISKDASTLQALILENETGRTNLTKEEINREISEIKTSMEHARKEFSRILKSIHNKNISYASYSVHIDSEIIDQSEYLKEMDKLWMEFNRATQDVIMAETTNSKMMTAIEFINDNNMRLLNISDRLLDQLLNESMELDKETELIEVGLLGLLFLLLAFYVYNLMRFIILPYNQLYKGITEIGLYSYPIKNKYPTRKRVMPLVSEVNGMFVKINKLISLIENINNNSSFMETLTYINQTFSVFIPYNYIGIALISEDKKFLKASYGVSDGSVIGLPEKFMGANWPLSDTSMGPYLESGEARVINDLEEYCAGKPIKPYNKIILDSGIQSSITLPLKVSGVPVGMIFFSSRYKNVYNDEHLNILNTLANSIAISLNQNIFASEMQYSSILALAKLSEARDEETGEHMERMTGYARMIAQLLHENEIYAEETTIEYIDLIEQFSPLHDIGKVGISDGILLKPGKLTPEEFNEMKKHTLLGAQVLKSADKNMTIKGKSLFGMGVEIAEGHHEKWDGTGYPYGKKEQEIPLSARIVAIADVFDALTSKRPYKDAIELDKSFEIIKEGRGKHFDPNIIDIVIKNRNKIEEIYHKHMQSKV